MSDDAPEIQQASQLLVTAMHCQQHALALKRCQKGLSSDRVRCERERQAYITCGNEHAHAVTAALTQIASAKCTDEVAAYHRCRSESLGSDCEAQDVAALRCASRHVLESALRPGEPG